MGKLWEMADFCGFSGATSWDVLALFRLL